MEDLSRRSDAELIRILESEDARHSTEFLAKVEAVLNKRGYAIEDEESTQVLEEEKEEKPMSMTRTLVLLGIFTIILGGRIATSNGGSWALIGIILPIIIIGMLIVQLVTKKK